MLKPVEQQLEKMGSDIAKPVEKMLEMKTFYTVKFVEQRLEKMGSNIAKPVEKMLEMKTFYIVKFVEQILEKIGSDISKVVCIILLMKALNIVNLLLEIMRSDIANLVMDYNIKVVFFLLEKMLSTIVKVLKLLGMRESGIRLIVLRFKEMTT